MRELESGYFSASSAGTRESLLDTFCAIAEAGGVVPFPLTLDGVKVVFACMRKAGYRSVAQYISRARQQNVALGYSVDERLALELESISRSVQRGIGEADRAWGLELAILARAPEVAESGTRGAPLHVRRAGIVGCWWILREIELSAVRLRAVRFDGERKEVTLFLPASKTDPSGEGKSRTHGCCCAQAEGAAICPYHVVQAQHAFATGIAEERADGPAADAPLFPAADGGAFSKKGWTTALQALVEAHEKPAEREARGARRIKGHSARRGGAQHMARAGIPKFVIQLFARWGSEAIRLYVEDTPLEGSASLAATAVRSWSEVQVREEVRRSDLTGLRADLRSEIERMREELRAELPRAMPAEAAAAGDEYVQNLRTGTVHIVRDGTGDSALWSTVCGNFRFGAIGASCARTRERPPLKARCKTCFGLLDQDLSDSGDSSSSEE